jgi:hypothetical protein
MSAAPPPSWPSLTFSNLWPPLRGGKDKTLFPFLFLPAPGLALKNPPKKTHPKKTKKNHLKKPTKNVFFLVFWVFLNCKFFMKLIQTFLFETDFYEQISNKL